MHNRLRMNRATIAICHRCPSRQKKCAGPCVCTISGKDIIEHAAAWECPRELFPARGLGDTVAKVLHWLRVDKLVKAILRKRCRCDERRAAMNEAVPYSLPAE